MADNNSKPSPDTWTPNAPGEVPNLVYSDGTTKWQRDMWHEEKLAAAARGPVPRRDPVVAGKPKPGNGVPEGKAGASPATVISRKKEETVSVKKLQFPPSDSANMKYGMQFKFVRQSYDKYGDKAKFTRYNNGGHIYLPLPTNILETLNTNYNISQLGAAGTLFEAGGQAMNALGQMATGEKQLDSAAVESAISNAMNVSGYVVRRTISALSQETAQAIDLKYGQVVNPYTVAVFESTTPRHHSLTFRLIPRTPADSEAIRAIVDAFKYHSMPSRSGGAEATGGIFLKMPEEVEVSFFGSQFLYKFARCVIQSVQVNYTPYGPPSFFAGTSAPTAVELTLGLQEIEQLTKESYGDDHIQNSVL